MKDFTVKPGRYRHFKGNEYTVLFTAKSTEDESEIVVYRAEYGANQIWGRPLKQFCDMVFSNGALVPRYSYIGDDLDERDI